MNKPNIVLLIMDTARASNFSTYGYERNTDPNISEIAEQGMTFRNCYANSIWTLPSHHSIFTGLLPSHHGATDKESREIQNKLLPEILGENGYRTVGISSNGFISPMYGFDSVFDEFEFIGDSLNIEEKMLFKDDEIFREVYEKEKEDHWDSKPQKYSYLLRESIKSVSLQTIGNGFYYLMSEKFNSERKDDGAKKANKLLKERFDDEEPFFGFINYVEPHDPYNPPKEIAKEFLDEKTFEEAMEISEKADLVKYLSESPGEEAEVLKNLYDAEIKYLDRRIGELVDTIEEKSERDTIFIIASDHGENFGEKDLWGHYGKITEELIHVPLVIKGLENKEIESNFPLRNLKELIEGLSEGKTEIKTKDKVISEYQGLESHRWNLEPEKFDNQFLQNQKSLVSENLGLWGENFEENLSESDKTYISIRCGEP